MIFKVQVILVALPKLCVALAFASVLANVKLVVLSVKLPLPPPEYPVEAAYL